MSRRALVLSGGGVKGAFQVGALVKLLAEESKPWYKVFCGVSVGAINCAFLSQFIDGKEAVKQLNNLWYKIKDHHVKKKWFPFHFLSGLWKTGLYNTDPLKNLIDDNFNGTHPENLLRVGAVDLKTLKYHVFSEYTLAINDIILASASFPVMFPAQEVGSYSLVDGGAREVTPLQAAIDIEDVTDIDVILTSPRKQKKQKKSPKNVVDVAKFALEAALDEVFINDLKIAELYNKLVPFGHAGGKRHVNIRIIEPTSPLPGDTLTFDHKTITKLISCGFDAIIS